MIFIARVPGRGLAWEAAREGAGRRKARTVEARGWNETSKRDLLVRGGSRICSLRFLPWLVCRPRVPHFQPSEHLLVVGTSTLHRRHAAQPAPSNRVEVSRPFPLSFLPCSAKKNLSPAKPSQTAFWGEKHINLASPFRFPLFPPHPFISLSLFFTEFYRNLVYLAPIPFHTHTTHSNPNPNQTKQDVFLHRYRYRRFRLGHDDHHHQLDRCGHRRREGRHAWCLYQVSLAPIV